MVLGIDIDFKLFSIFIVFLYIAIFALTLLWLHTRKDTTSNTKRITLLEGHHGDLKASLKEAWDILNRLDEREK